MLQNIFDSAARGEFAHSDKALCGCRGGWFLSDVDTWHECPCHFLGQPCPEDEDGLGSIEWQKFSLLVRGFDTTGAERFHVVARQKVTGTRLVHQVGFGGKSRAVKLMSRVAKSGCAFSELDLDHWAGPRAWPWPKDETKP